MDLYVIQGVAGGVGATTHALRLATLSHEAHLTVGIVDTSGDIASWHGMPAKSRHFPAQLDLIVPDVHLLQVETPAGQITPADISRIATCVKNQEIDALFLSLPTHVPTDPLLNTLLAYLDGDVAVERRHYARCVDYRYTSLTRALHPMSGCWMHWTEQSYTVTPVINSDGAALNNSDVQAVLTDHPVWFRTYEPQIRRLADAGLLRPFHSSRVTRLLTWVPPTMTTSNPFTPET